MPLSPDAGRAICYLMKQGSFIRNHDQISEAGCQ